MVEVPSRQKISDDDVKRILLAEPGQVAIVAADIGIHPASAIGLRQGNSKRALRVARGIGLTLPVRSYAKREPDDDKAVFVVNGVRG